MEELDEQYPFILRLEPPQPGSGYGPKAGLFRCLARGCDWNTPSGVIRAERTIYHHNKEDHGNQLQPISI